MFDRVFSLGLITFGICYCVFLISLCLLFSVEPGMVLLLGGVCIFFLWARQHLLHDTYFEDYVAEKPILNEENRKQLKQLFRRAAQSCHPDRVPEHLKDAAHELFTQLNAAFQANDIEGVRNISDIVCSGVFSVDRLHSQSAASSR